MKLIALNFLFLCQIVSFGYTANILAVFPIASVSHNIVFKALTDELLARGHQITIITTTPSYGKDNANVIEIDLSYMYQVIGKLASFNKWKEAELDEVAMLGMWTDILDAYYDEQFNHPTIKEMIQKKDSLKFDTVIVEFLNHHPWQAFATLFNAPVIGISTMDMIFEYHKAHGNVYNPIIHPDYVFPFYNALTFRKRARVLRYHAWYELYYKSIYYGISDKVIKRHIGEINIPVMELNGIAEVLLINAHPALHHVRPVLPTTVYLGFLHVKDPKPIVEEKIKKFLDSSTKPIIYMSLGTIAKSSGMNEATLDIFKQVFAELPYDIMWKYEKEEMENKPSNVFAYRWFPQADLLAHERVKLFITQGGQQSMEEAIDRGVPMVVVPFAADQESNSNIMKDLGIGLPLDINRLTKEKLKETIMQVLDGDYAKNVKKLRDVVRDAPMKPIDKAVWWVEYVIRHGGTLHLDYAGRHVPFWKYMMLDFIGIGILILFVIIKILKFLLSKLLGSKNVKKPIQKRKKGKSD